MNRILTLVFALFSIVSSQGQSFYAIRQERSFMLTGGTGTSTYYGELSNPGTYIKFQPNFNVGLQTYVSPRISVRTELNWFILQGSDKLANSQGRKVRGLSFHSSCFEISATGAINIFSNGNRYYRRPIINGYAFAGFGVLYFNPKGDLNGKSYALEPLHTEGKSYSRVVPVIPFGFGIRLKVSPNTNIVIEGGYRKTFTDYLDDVSGKYAAPDPNDKVRAYFENPNSATYNTLTPIAAGESNNFKEGSKRGNPSSNDSYFLLNAKIEYYLPFNASYSKRGGAILRKRSSMYRYNKRGGIRRR
ncbi:MAG: DUF6089 family protein [Cyclobacteriaceae bacterium]